MYILFNITFYQVYFRSFLINMDFEFFSSSSYFGLSVSSFILVCLLAREWTELLFTTPSPGAAYPTFQNPNLPPSPDSCCCGWSSFPPEHLLGAGLKASGCLGKSLNQATPIENFFLWALCSYIPDSKHGGRGGRHIPFNQLLEAEPGGWLFSSPIFQGPNMQPQNQ